MKIIKNIKYGFTLLEMSIVILIMSILFVGGVNLYLSIVELSEKNLTADRVYVVNEAITKYVLRHLRLPCPADILLEHDDPNYGEELRNPDTSCGVTASRFGNGNYIAGGVPFKELELPSDYAEDAWGSRIIYIVDKNYAKANGLMSSGGASIIIQDTEGNLATNKAIYVVLSTGPNENGAFKGGVQNTPDTSLEDKENLFLTTVSFDNKFIKDINNKQFDDIVYYKDKNSLVFELDLEDMPCSMEDLADVEGATFPTSSDIYCPGKFCLQGVEIFQTNKCPNGYISENPNMDSSNNYKPSRICQKYGQWSNIMYECVRGCGKSNIASLTGTDFPTANSLLNSIEEKYLYRVKEGDTITLDCGKTGNKKTGYVILKCNEVSLKWTIEDSSCISTNNKI